MCASACIGIAGPNVPNSTPVPAREPNGEAKNFLPFVAMNQDYGVIHLANQEGSISKI